MSEFQGGYAHTPLDYTRLINVVDSITETRGMGVVIIANGEYF